MIENRILWVATITIVATFQFWQFLQPNSFYIGSALFIFILCSVIYRQNKGLLVSFLLLCLSANNLIDELFFDPKKNGSNEVVFLILIPVIYYANKNFRQRIIYFFNKNHIPRIFGNRCKNCNRDEKK